MSVLLLLLPTEDGPQKSVGKPQIPSQVASVPARDVTFQLDGFCGRNVDVCAAGSLLFDTLQRKAKYAARLVYDWANSGAEDQPLKPRRTGPQQTALRVPVRLADAADGLVTGTVKPRRKPNPPRARKPSGNTLELKDLVPTWQGPDKRIRT
jgi:hypothetical protein